MSTNKSKSKSKSKSTKELRAEAIEILDRAPEVNETLKKELEAVGTIDTIKKELEEERELKAEEIRAEYSNGGARAENEMSHRLSGDGEEVEAVSNLEAPSTPLPEEHTWSQVDAEASVFASLKGARKSADCRVSFLCNIGDEMREFEAHKVYSLDGVKSLKEWMEQRFSAVNIFQVYLAEAEAMLVEGIEAPEILEGGLIDYELLQSRAETEAEHLAKNLSKLKSGSEAREWLTLNHIRGVNELSLEVLKEVAQLSHKHPNELLKAIRGGMSLKVETLRDLKKRLNGGGGSGGDGDGDGDGDGAPKLTLKNKYEALLARVLAVAPELAISDTEASAELYDWLEDYEEKRLKEAVDK